MGMMPGSLCLVAVELDYVVKNGGIGTTNWALAHLLARHGWNVHILYCTPVADRATVASVTMRLAQASIAFTHIDDLKLPKAVAAPDALGGVYLPISERVRHALEELHRRHRFDLIEFAEVVGAGFRAIQAKRAGLAFADAGMIVKLHSMSQWLREGNRWWMNSSQDLLIDFIERRAFEQADFPLSPSRYLLDYAGQIGWQVGADARVVRYPFPQPQPTPYSANDLATQPPNQPVELVFFGRLEIRKGLELFLNALDNIEPSRPVTFVGKDTILEDGSLASELIEQRLAGRPHQVFTDFDRDKALAYLAGRDCLAILPSLVENYANALIECLVNGIPFLASRVGGMPEIVPEELHAHLLFDPTADDLVRCVRAYFAASSEERREWCERATAAANVEQHNQKVVDAYTELLDQVRRDRPTAAPSPPPQPCVTVAVYHRNDRAGLTATLRSLAEQSHAPLDVHVVDDGSTDPAALQAFAHQEPLYPRYHFIRQPHAGRWAARNRVLAEAAGELFLPLAAGDVLEPEMLQRLVDGLRHNDECLALTCYVLEVKKPADRKRARYSSASRPTGGPFLMGSLINVYGDDVALFRTEVLRAVGGFEPPAPGSLESDWPTYVKLTRLGHTLGVVPEYLVWRVATGVSRRSAAWFGTHRQVIEQYIQARELTESERLQLWTALVSFHQQHTEQLERLHKLHHPLRYRVVDQANALVKSLPLAHSLGRSAAAFGMALWKRLAGSGRRLNREVVK